MNRAVSIAIVGYGKMGRAVESVALDEGHRISQIVDPIDPGATIPVIDRAGMVGADVAVEFSTPATAQENVLGLLDADVPVVCGTTGWNESLEQARELSSSRGVGFLWAPNFSLGMSILFRLVAEASHWFSSAQGFSPWLVEAHHDQKKDGPSGTACRLAESMVAKTAGKTGFGPPPADRPIDPGLLPVSWIRAGTIPGEHRIGWDAVGETFEMTHRARDRRVFATGAVRAAQWLVGKSGPHTFDEMLDELVFTPARDSRSDNP